MTGGPEPSLAELLAEIEALGQAKLGALNEALAEVAVEVQAQRAEFADEAARDAQRARSGELGADMRRLQERVDLGQTSWGAVISGADASPEAASAREQTARNAESFASAVDAEFAAEREAGRTDPRSGAVDALARLRAFAADVSAQHGGGPARGQ